MTIPQTMKAIDISEPGGPEVLLPVTADIPAPREEEVLIKVSAAGVNRPDILQRIGKYPVPQDADPRPGLEVSGTVVALGEGADRWKTGDRVCALTHGGGYAEYCRVHQGHCLPIPADLDPVQAAALPETSFTVWYNVFTRSCLQAGEWFLVHGGTSGIGTTAIQLAKAMGARVIATAGTDEKCAFCKDLGADHAFNYRTEDWANGAEQVTQGRGVDVILDMVGGDYFQKNINILGRDGRYALIASLGGVTTEVNITPIMRNRLTITGSTLRPQTDDEKSQIARDLAREMWPLIDEGRIGPVIYETFPLADASSAHRLMESGEHMGKIVLRVE